MINGLGDYQAKYSVTEKLQPFVVRAAGASVGKRRVKKLPVREAMTGCAGSPRPGVGHRAISTALLNLATSDRFAIYVARPS